MTMSLPSLLLVIAAICGAIGKAIAGGARGGLIVSIALGFVGVIVLSFDRVTTPQGHSTSLSASLADFAKSGKKTAGIIGGSAAGGALLGKILGGETKDAVLGAVLGGGIGTGIAAGTKGKELEIPAGTELLLALDESLSISVRSQ